MRHTQVHVVDGHLVGEFATKVHEFEGVLGLDAALTGGETVHQYEVSRDVHPDRGEPGDRQGLPGDLLAGCRIGNDEVHAVGHAVTWDRHQVGEPGPVW